MRKLKKAIIGVLASAMLMGAMTGCGKAEIGRASCRERV